MTDDHHTPASDDPRVRIRDAALDQFATHGFRGASVRGIAASAGVSAGLVQHHFTTKEKLREECDAYVLAVIREIRVGVVGGRLGNQGGDQFVADSAPKVFRVLPYLTRGLLDGDSNIASTWFAATAEEYRAAFADDQFADPIPPDQDIDAIIATYTAMQLGMGVFLNEIGRYLNIDMTSPEALIRLSKARLFLAGEQLIHEDVRQQIEQGFDAYLEHERTRSHPEQPPNRTTHPSQQPTEE